MGAQGEVACKWLQRAEDGSNQGHPCCQDVRLACCALSDFQARIPYGMDPFGCIDRLRIVFENVCATQERPRMLVHAPAVRMLQCPQGV